MTRVTKITLDRLVDALDYDPASGEFLWKIRPSNRIKVGDRAGVVADNGHRYISVDREKLQASRLAWFYVHGVWPEGDIRQHDGNHDNCAITNLRDVSRIDAARERGLISTNSTGFKGVSPAKFGKFQASITWNYRLISLGANFETAEAASAAYLDAEVRLSATASDPDRDVVMGALRAERRLRAAWLNLTSRGDQIGWKSLQEFAMDVADVPAHRYAMAPKDASKPIGPGNYVWASSGNTINSKESPVAYNRANREANRDHHRDRDFRKKYGIDFADYQRMLVEQKGVCAVCEQPETKLQHGSIRMLSVDHNHATGAVRGLLCANCNLAIGYACDDVIVLQKTIGYLRKHAGVDTVVPFGMPLSFGT